MQNLRVSVPGCQIAFFLTGEFPENCVQKGPFLHSHSNFEIRYDIKGFDTLTGVSDVCSPRGVFTLIPPHVEHSSLFVSISSPVYVTAVFFSVSPDKENENVVSQLYDLLLSVKNPIAVPDTFGGFRLLSSLTESAAAFSSEIRCANLLLLLTRICSSLSCGNDAVLSVSRQGGLLTQQIEQYIIERYQDPDCTLYALAKSLYISERQLHRMFCDFYGMTFRQLLKQTRMEMAKTLLFSTSLPTSDIAEKVGYRSKNAFFEAYRSYYGVSSVKRTGNPPSAKKPVRSAR